MPTFCYIFKMGARKRVTNELSKLVLGTRKKIYNNILLYTYVLRKKLNLDHYVRSARCDRDVDVAS